MTKDRAEMLIQDMIEMRDIWIANHNPEDLRAYQALRDMVVGAMLVKQPVPVRSGCGND